MERIGKSNPFGVSWILRTDGTCEECGGTQIQVSYPANFEGFSGREYDLLCINCGTSVNEKRGTKLDYDKRELLFETMEVRIPSAKYYRYHSK